MTISVTDTTIEKKAIGRYTRRSHRLRIWLFWIYCGIFLISSAGFYVSWYTNMFNDYVLSHMELRNGTRTFDWWQHPPFKLKFKLYIFNYTNVDEFQAGKTSKLRVQELGPYDYYETVNRMNVVLHDNDTVTFQTKRSYEWIGGRCSNDTVIIPNVLLMFITAYIRDLNFPVRLFVNMMLLTLQEQSFINQTVNNFFWGYNPHLFQIIKPLIMLQRDIPEKFGMLVAKNGVDIDRITIHTRGVENLGVIDQVNGMNNRHVWDDERCDKIDGSDGTLFPPYLIRNTSKPLYIYFKDICRKIPLHFTEQVTIFDISSLRYKFTPDAYNFSDKQNECFCPKVHGKRICPPAGIFNMSACNYNLPLLMSFPHFYGADKFLLEQIDGLNPQQKDHESYLDIHSRLAIPVAGWTRFQINLEVRKTTGMFGNLKDGTILPLFWFETGIDELPQQLLEVLWSTHFIVSNVEMAIQWGTLITMILSLSAMIVCLWKYYAEQDSCDVILQKNSFVQNNLELALELL